MLVGLKEVLDGKAKSGNYHKALNPRNDEIFEVYYHTTVICAYNRTHKVFFADNRGFNTRSTNRAVKDCQYYFSSKGYTELGVDDFQSNFNVECHVGGWA